MKTDPSIPRAPGEEKESLWTLIVSPTIWAGHFMLSYITAAVWCEKFAPPDGSLQPVRWAVAGYTVAALAGIACNGWSGFRRHRFGKEPLPHDLDTPGDRHRFIGFATLLLAGLSGVAVLFAAVAVAFFHDCR